MQFEFSTATKIIFGSGRLNSIGDLLSGMGKRVLIISGGPQKNSERLSTLLEQCNAWSSTIRINGEPTVEVVQNTVQAAQDTSADCVIGIGGGSAIDTAKATATLATNPGNITDYLEVIGLNQPINIAALPLIAIPTTAGTGSEVTKNAVIGSPAHHIKVSIRSPHLLPRVALIDPELTLSVPPDITAFTGLDALTQLIEPYTCVNPNPLTDAVCIEGLRHIARSFRQAYDDGRNLQAREDMSLASLFSGLALANAKLGAVHGLASPIGGEISAHHGAICARLLPIVMAVNVNALTKLSADHPVLSRYGMIGRLLSGDPDATVDTAIQWIRAILQHMKIRSLSEFGLGEDHFQMIIDKALKSSSMKGNPIILSKDDLRNILQQSLYE